MIARTYAVESLLYRTAGMIDDAHRRRRTTRPTDRPRRRFEEYAVEASIAKVAGSETLELRARRERPDPRRQRLRARLPGRAPLPRRAREPHFRRHQRDQPAADPGHAGAARGQRRAWHHSAAAKALQDELLGPPAMPSADDDAARRRAARRRGVQEDGADGVRHRDADVRRASSPTSRKC